MLRASCSEEFNSQDLSEHSPIAGRCALTYDDHHHVIPLVWPRLLGWFRKLQYPFLLISLLTNVHSQYKCTEIFVVYRFYLLTKIASLFHHGDL